MPRRRNCVFCLVYLIGHIASFNLPQTQLVWRGKPTATPCRKYSSPAATPTRKKLHQSTLLNHSCNWMTAPTPADSVQRDISSWPPSASTWRRTMPWSMLWSSLVLAVKKALTQSFNWHDTTKSATSNSCNIFCLSTQICEQWWYFAWQVFNNIKYSCSDNRVSIHFAI